MAYTKEENNWFDSLKPSIRTAYIKTLSVSQVLDILKHKSFGNIKRIGREKVVQYLKQEGIYQPHSKNAISKRVAATNQTLLLRYGVDNAGKLPHAGGYTKLNDVNYTPLNVYSEINLYKKEVNRITKQFHRKHKTNNTLPHHCYYTGIRFTDSEQDKVNPNDPRKRSIDHKVPVIQCFFEGLSPEQCADSSNLVYVLKYVNSCKSNTPEKEFIPLANSLREKLIDEGFESNTPRYTLQQT